MLNQILENNSIENLVKIFSRSPLQQNCLHESDAELIKLPGTNITLAITVDSIVEEIEAGLYTDPYLIGWMTVMVNASDLAAVGAEPLGILINETLLSESNENFNNSLQQGIEDACIACNIHILGGDTNFSSRMEITGCAVGCIPEDQSLTRLGCKPGDFLFISGKPGMGSAFALKQLKNDSLTNPVSITYQPKSRLREGRLLLNYANCCMDTSDGVFATLDQLMRLNNVGFQFESNPEDFIHKDALSICISANVPLWLMLAGHHGEFELVFTISSDDMEEFLKKAHRMKWKPVLLGSVIEKPDIRMLYKNKLVSVDTGYIRNLFVELHGDVEEYIKKLLELDKTFTGVSNENK
jgi:thiamine-monophosphate kinase